MMKMKNNRSESSPQKTQFLFDDINLKPLDDNIIAAFSTTASASKATCGGISVLY